MISRYLLSVSAALLAGTVANAATITPVTPTKSNGCYQISTAEELYGFAEIVNGKDETAKDESACGKLLKDIVVNTGVLDSEGYLNDENAANFVPWNPIDRFSGTFDGNGHVIAGLYRDVSDEADARDVGFIRNLVATPDGKTVIKNLGIVDSYFAVRSLYAGEIVGIFAANVVDSDGTDGEESYAKILNCFNQSSGNYGGRSFINDLFYWVDKHVTLTIENCYNTQGKEFFNTDKGTVIVKNSFILGSKESPEKQGIKTATEVQFANGAVASALHNGIDGSVWGQDVGTDAYPNFSGKVKNSAAARYSVTFHTFKGDPATYFDKYISGFNTALPETVEKENAVFFGWYSNSAFDGEPDTLIADTVKGNLEYWAKLKNRYKIYFHSNGGKYKDTWSADLINQVYFEDSVYTYIEGARARLPYALVSREGHIFLSWYDNEELTGAPVDSIVETDVGEKHFYASWYKMSKPELDIADNCYVISDKAELFGFAAMVRGTYGDGEGAKPGLCGKLTKDIVVNENVLKRNGTLDSSRISAFMEWYPITDFSGMFDGQGHKISGLYGSPLFGYISAGESEKPVVIRNVTVDDSYGDGSGLVGSVGDSSILSMDNCHYSGYVHSWSDIVTGGLIRRAFGYINMSNSSFEGTIYADAVTFVGGLIGESLTHLVLVQSYMKGSVELLNTMKDDYYRLYGAGSLVGHLTGHAIIANNYSITDFTGEKTMRGHAGGQQGAGRFHE